MDGLTQTKICESCGDSFETKLIEHGARRRFCHGVDCPQHNQWKRKPKSHTCRQCGVVFIAKHRPLYCSSECRKIYNDPIIQSRYKKRYVKNKLKNCVCNYCNKIFVVSHKRKYCSDYCAWRTRAERAGSKPKGEWEHGLCADCQEPITRINPNDKYCRDCGKPAARNARKIDRTRRNGTVEKINPKRIFDRDGWRCYICGIPTPKNLSGKYKPDSPEIDHIIPVSKGGQHNYRNVACCCGKCNREKGAKSHGEFTKTRQYIEAARNIPQRQAWKPQEQAAMVG